VLRSSEDKAQLPAILLFAKEEQRHNPGLNVGMGKDHTLFALIDGIVTFKKKKDNKSFVSDINEFSELV